MSRLNNEVRVSKHKVTKIGQLIQIEIFYTKYKIGVVLQRDQVRSGRVRLGRVRLGQFVTGSIRLRQVRLSQVRLGYVRLDQVKLRQKYTQVNNLHMNVKIQLKKIANCETFLSPLTFGVEVCFESVCVLPLLFTSNIQYLFSAMSLITCHANKILIFSKTFLRFIVSKFLF